MLDQEDKPNNSDGDNGKQDPASRHGVPSFEIELLQNILLRSAARGEDVWDQTTLNLSQLVRAMRHVSTEAFSHS